jgi:hypothetical protein
MAEANARYSAIKHKCGCIGFKPLDPDAGQTATLVLTLCFRRIADSIVLAWLQPLSLARPSVGTVKPPSFENHSYFFILQDKMVSLATTIRHRRHRSGTTMGSRVEIGGWDGGGGMSDG